MNICLFGNSDSGIMSKSSEIDIMTLIVKLLELFSLEEKRLSEHDESNIPKKSE